MPSKHLIEYLENQNINIDNLLTSTGDSLEEMNDEIDKVASTNQNNNLTTPISDPLQDINNEINSTSQSDNQDSFVMSNNTVEDVISLPKIPFPNEVL